MLKKLSYGVACLSVALIVAGVTMVRVEVRQTPRAAAPAAATFNHPNPSAVDMPRVLKKTELFSQGHAADVVDIQQVWSAYGFYIDSGNGEGAASLYTEDGVIQHFWSDKGSTFEPHGGVGSFPTPYGTVRGGPCIVRGREQIKRYFGEGRTVTPRPGWGHHTSPNDLVKVNDDGKTAVLTTTMLIVSTNDKGVSSHTTGGYRVFFKKTSEGWQIAEQYNFADRPRGNNRCDVNGPVNTK